MMAWSRGGINPPVPAGLAGLAWPCEDQSHKIKTSALEFWVRLEARGQSLAELPCCG